jgi:taurine dioxygenase
MTFTLTPFDAPLGAEVRGFDFSAPVDADERAALVAAIDEHLLLLFRNGDDLPSNQQVAGVCRAIGPLRPTLADRSRLPDEPGINRVSNRDANGVQGTGGHDWVSWHSDLSFQPPLIEFLYLDAVSVPPEGGDTSWTNLSAAYDALPASTQEHIDDLGVRYRLRDGLDFSGYFKASDPARLYQDTEISLVQRNPRTGRKGVWPNTGPDFEAEVQGIPAADGRALLEELFEHCTRAEFVYRHQWRAGDACIWLNTHTMHAREAFPDTAERVLRHVNILGRADPRQAAVSA